MAIPYENKFTEFFRMCDAKNDRDIVVPSRPEALGDNYREL
jgi:hypothetical protein